MSTRRSGEARGRRQSACVTNISGSWADRQHKAGDRFGRFQLPRRDLLVDLGHEHIYFLSMRTTSSARVSLAGIQAATSAPSG